ncbi:MAG: glycosyltransferase [Bacteroidetes bacterium]|nr:glycosyltransferase [Bacteroidota bacterium]
MNKHPHPALQNARLLEVSWEVCNQLGGIYTVIRSKVQAMVERWGDDYALAGPWTSDAMHAEFDPMPEPGDALGRAVQRFRAMGHEVAHGRWLVTGRPRVVLIKPEGVFDRLNVIKGELSTHYGIPERNGDELYNQALLWGEMVRRFLKILQEEVAREAVLLVHCHEWMAATPILGCALDKLPIRTIFTTHATMLGRVLAMHDPQFYDHLADYDDSAEAARFGLSAIHGIEKQSAKAATIFTTVSEITGLECEHLLGRKPHKVTPNGLNIDRFATNHEVQVRHDTYKEKIHQFILGHFFQSYGFDLKKTLYFFTSGRYEYRNKGYDLTLEALSRLNKLMAEAGIEKTVVCFFITKRPTYSINPDVLEARGILEEIRRNSEAITEQLGERLFYAAAASDEDHRLPQLNDLVDDYWKLRYRRTIQSWKSKRWPIVVTHNLVDDQNDEVLHALRAAPLVNSPLDKVKVVYHPDFITSTSPLFGMDYSQFVRGCHLGIFPSYYEPWGYTPLECIARGVPAVTSDLSGFGKYVQAMRAGREETGVFVLRRQRRSDDQAADDLARFLFEFVKTSGRYRTILRNQLEDFSEKFDWRLLTLDYDEAYELAATGAPA